MLIALGTFAGIIVLVLVPYWLLVVTPEQGEARALRKRLKAPAARLVRPELLRTELPLSSVPVLARVLRQSRLVTEPVHRQIVQSASQVTVGTVLLAMGFLGCTTGAVVFWLTRSPMLALVAGPLAAMVPYGILTMRATRRLRTFEEQFPEAIELLARALRAGHAFTTGLAMVGDELPDPVAAEFQLVHDRQAFGMPIADALRDMAQRIPLIDARFFVTAVLTQREAGGNLAEVLDNLGALIRERFKVIREVRTLSAHGRVTGWILVGLAPMIAGVLTFIAPKHVALLVTDPVGRLMVTGALVLQVLGVFIIRRIINIEV